MPENFQVTGLRVEYKKAAIYGETMILKRAMHGNVLTAVLCDENDNAYAIVEFV